MIQVEIIANRLQIAEDLAGLLSSDEGIEVLHARALGSAFTRASPLMDVVVAVSLGAAQIPGDGPPVIALSDRPLLRGSPALHAWLPLNSSIAEISAAIVAVAHGLYVMTSDQFRSGPSVTSAEMNDSALTVEKLTHRELQVLTMMADGLANKEIAASLSISGNTVKFHVAQVLAKLGVASRTEAVRAGIRRGLIAI